MKLSRILSLSLTTLMLSAGSALADNPTSGTCGDNCSWELSSDGKTVTITGSNDKNNPATMQDYSSSKNDSGTWVTTAPWGHEVTSVQFEGYLGNIGAQAFVGSDLTSVSIPSSVTTIGNSAFYGSLSIQSVDFGDNSQLQSIGKSAFYSNTSLSNVDFGKNSQLQSIGEYAFGGNIQLGRGSDPNTEGSFTIPASVGTIGEYAFDGANFDTLIFEEGSRLNPLVNSDASIAYGAFNGSIDSIIGLDQVADLLGSDKNNFWSDVNRPFSNNHFYQTTMNSNHVTTFYCQDMDACQAYVNDMLSTGEINPNSIFKMYTYNEDKGYNLDGLYYKTMADLLSGNSYVPKMPKRIYAVDEAVEATSKHNKNTFSIRYR